MVDTEKSVLALQGFLSHDDDARIMGICSSVQHVEGYTSALGSQFIPHITLASWNVTRQQLADVDSQCQERLRGLPAVQAKMSLVARQRDDDRRGYFLEPDKSDTLLRFHEQVHHRLNWSFEPFRQIDLPGKWWPHLTLFTISALQETQVRSALEQLEKIHIVSVDRIGIVSFLKGTDVIGEVKLGVQL